MLTDVKNIRRGLKRLFDLLAEEADRNPEFAVRLADALGQSEPTQKPPKVSGQPKIQRTKTPAPDPFAALREKGVDGFREWLNTIGLADLKAIIRQHRLDPTRLSDKWKSQDRLVDLIFDRVRTRGRQGETFREYGERSAEDQSSPDTGPQQGTREEAHSTESQDSSKQSEEKADS